ncbi:DUF7845 domain-containing protein [Haloarcula amylovorans]|uniref:DUF7845 domain-containing protein n=1 Tax=Haloarcula amylovorans TaxID=2562280 RepID=UPI001075FF5D|nr:hypothetical protein [Halomicroarcula amylolytica]
MTGVVTSIEDVIDLQPHRIGAHTIFDNGGLSPYWAMVSQYEPDLDEREETFTFDDIEYEIVRSSHWQGKIEAPPSATFDGAMNEYKLGVYAADDPHNELGADFTFRPGFPKACHVETGDLIGGMPTECPESVRVQIESTNLSQFEVLGLLQSLASYLSIDAGYFVEAHEWSRIYALELYGRIERDTATGKVAGKGGVLEHLSQFSNGRGRGEHHWDHEAIKGHYEAVALSPDNWKRLLPDQTLAKRLKCYQPKWVRSETSSDDPLFHHKIECQYWADYYPDGESPIQWTGYDTAVAEFRETVVNALHWAGVDFAPDSDVWIEDPYFEPGQADDAVGVRPNPMPDLEQQTRADAADQLAGPGTSEGAWDVLVAMTDGGGRHYQEVADEAGKSASTVYRAAERFADIIEVDNGMVRFRDGVVRDQIEEIAERWQSTKETTMDSLKRVADRASPFSRRDDGEPSALERWANRHGIVVHSTKDPLEMELKRPVGLQEMLKILRSGLDAAEASPLPSERFENALIDWTGLDGQVRKGRRVVNNGRFLGKHEVHRSIW